jgi:hypothetical protein
VTKKQQQIIIIGVVAILIVLVGAYMFGIKPQLSSRAEHKAATAVAQTQVDTLTGTLSTLKTKEADLPNAKAKAKGLATAFPADFEQDSWIKMMTVAAAEANVKVATISVTQPTDALTSTPGSPGAVAAAPAAPAATGTTTPTANPAAGTTPVSVTSDVAVSTVSLSITGPRANVVNYLHALESMTRPLLIDAVTASQGEAGPDVTVSITGKTFLVSPLVDPSVKSDGTTKTTK